MTDRTMTTGEAAKVLGVSRQHVVNLCNRGELDSTRVGTHRRLRPADVDALRTPVLREEVARSLWLHRAVLGVLVETPERVIAVARANLERAQQDLPRSREYHDAWVEVLGQGIEAIAAVCTASSSAACELRANSPFAGVLTDDHRAAVLASFRRCWNR